MYLDDFGVHPSSGRAYGLQIDGKMAYVYELTSIPRVISTVSFHFVNIDYNVFQIVVPSAEWNLSMYQLVFLKDSVCTYEPQGQHESSPPQDPDLMCTMIDDGDDYTGSALFNVPGLGRDQCQSPSLC